MEHKPGFIVVIVLSVVIFAVTVYANALASGAISKPAIFKNTTGDVSNAYYIEITPAGWSFSIWGLIYVWQTVWLAYALSTLCRTTSYGYMYVSPAHIPPLIYILFIFANIFNVAWLVTWDRFYPEYALLCIILTAICLYLTFYYSCYQLHNSAAILLREDKSKDVWMTRLLLHNGIALYVAWVTIAFLLNLAIVLTYNAGLEQAVSSTLSMSLLLALIICWFFLETCVFDTFVRYVPSPYIAVVVALGGIIDKNWDNDNTTSVLTAVTLAAGVVLCVVRVIIMSVRHCTHPMYSTESLLFQTRNSYGTLSPSYERLPVSDQEQQQLLFTSHSSGSKGSNKR